MSSKFSHRLTRYFRNAFAAAALSVGLFGCSPDLPPPDCVSPNGAELFNHGDCAGFDAAESRALAAFAGILPGLRDRLNGLGVRMHVGADDGGRYVDGYGRRIGGATLCYGGTIVVGLADTWQRSAYAHELVHIAECPDTDDEHLTWDARGIWAALNEANR